MWMWLGSSSQSQTVERRFPLIKNGCMEVTRFIFSLYSFFRDEFPQLSCFPFVSILRVFGLGMFEVFDIMSVRKR